MTLLNEQVGVNLASILPGECISQINQPLPGVLVVYSGAGAQAVIIQILELILQSSSSEFSSFIGQRLGSSDGWVVRNSLFFTYSFEVVVLCELQRSLCRDEKSPGIRM